MSYSITWADILKTWYLDQPLLVINEKNGDYQSIKSEHIKINAGDYRFTKWLLVPHSFDIIIQTDNVLVNIHMEALNTHYNSIIYIINYWRYHMKCTGYITVGSKTEIIDDIAITEFIRFRPF